MEAYVIAGNETVYNLYVGAMHACLVESNSALYI